MVMLETFFLTFTGAPIGMFLAWLCIVWTGSVGVDLGSFADGFETAGFSSVVHPYMEGAAYVDITLMVVCIALLSAVYPAIKALRLKPAEAIRKI